MPGHINCPVECLIALWVIIPPSSDLVVIAQQTTFFVDVLANFITLIHFKSHILMPRHIRTSQSNSWYYAESLRVCVYGFAFLPFCVMYQYLLIETSKAFLQVGVCFPFLTVEVLRGFTSPLKSSCSCCLSAEVCVYGKMRH